MVGGREGCCPSKVSGRGRVRLGKKCSMKMEGLVHHETARRVSQGRGKTARWVKRDNQNLLAEVLGWAGRGWQGFQGIDASPRARRGDLHHGGLEVGNGARLCGGGLSGERSRPLVAVRCAFPSPTAQLLQRERHAPSLPALGPDSGPGDAHRSTHWPGRRSVRVGAWQRGRILGSGGPRDRARQAQTP